MSWRRKRMEALLVDEATGNLSAEEMRELERLLQQHSSVDRYAFERVAAAVVLAGAARPDDQMPEHLTRRIVDAAEKLLAGSD